MNAPVQVNVPPNPVVEVCAPGGHPVSSGNALKLSVSAGPCQMERRSHALETAPALKQIAQRLGVALVYKPSFDKANRTSGGAERGIGLKEALPIFAEIGDTVGLPVFTDGHEISQCDKLATVVDVRQIPALLCRQTDLLVAAARTGRGVNIKKGQCLAPSDMKNVIATVTGAGNADVLACERGVSFGYNTLVSDLRVLPVLKEIGCPVVFDAAQSAQQPGGAGASSGGQRDMAPVLARAATAVGVACMFPETHPDPDHAPSDGPNMVRLDAFETLVADLLCFDALAKGSA